jgi:hypothetical protein
LDVNIGEKSLIKSDQKVFSEGMVAAVQQGKKKAATLYANIEENIIEFKKN